MRKLIITILSVILMMQGVVPVLADEAMSSTDLTTTSEVVETDQDATTFSASEDELVENEAQSTYQVENDNKTQFQSSTEFTRSLLKSDYRDKHVIDYAKKEPMIPVFSGGEVTVSTYKDFKDALQSKQSVKVIVKPNSTITFNETVTIPTGYSKELDLGGNTINAQTNGSILVNGDYFKMKNGHITGGLGNAVDGIPHISKPNSSGFIRSAYVSNTYSRDLVFEDITHKNTSNYADGRDAMGGFLYGEGSNIFFIGNNKLSNGNFNIKSGNVTFLEGTFIGEVTRQTTGYPGWDSYGYGTNNIGYMGYLTGEQKEPSGPEKGDKRIYVAEGAEVELYNLNTAGGGGDFSRYTNNISNFSTLTVEGSLKMSSSGAPLRSILSETLNSSGVADPYKKSIARTYNGKVNINVMEGATLIAKTQKSTSDQGVIFSYKTTINLFSPEKVELHDISTTTIHPVFHAGYGAGGYDRPEYHNSINIYDSEINLWKMKNTFLDMPPIKRNVNSFENSGFYTFNLTTNYFVKGKTTLVEPFDSTLNNLTMIDYGRIVVNGDMPVIVPDEAFKQEGKYQFNNNDSTFYGTSYFMKLDENGNLLPVVKGDVKLVNKKDPQVVFNTTTEANGNWKFDFDSPMPGGEYLLTVNDGNRGKGQKSKVVPVTIHDKTPPTGETKLYKIKKGDKEALKNPGKDSVLSANDETTPKDRLIYEYYGLTEAERLRIIGTPGPHKVVVEIEDEAGNYTRLDAPVLVYEGDEPKDAYITGRDFDISRQLFVGATPAEKRELILKNEYGNAKGYRLTDTTIEDVTADPNAFLMDIGPPLIKDGVESCAIVLSVAGTNVTKTIYARLLDDTMEIKVHQIEVLKGIPTIDDLKKQQVIYGDLVNKKTVPTVTYYIEKPKTSQQIPVSTILDDLEQKGRIRLDRTGYNRIKPTDDEYWVILSDLSGNKVKKTSSLDVDVSQTNISFDIYIEYNPLTTFASVPNLDYGEIKVTKKAEETHPLLTPTVENGDTVGSNKVTVINTAERETWSVNLALDKDGILKKQSDSNKEKETFLGSLIYYKGGQELVVTDQLITLESYQKPSSAEIDLIKEYNLHSSQVDEGLRLKQRMGNSIGDYQGNLIWTLTDAPIP